MNERGFRHAAVQSVLRVPAILLLMTGTPAASAGQTSLSFSGYLVDFPTYQKTSPALATLAGTPGEEFLNITRLRLRPSLAYRENLQLAMEYELSSLYRSGHSAGLLKEREPSSQVFDLSWSIHESEHLTVINFIDRLHLSWWFEEGEVVLGRQRIAWGTGRIWNPTDLFNPISPTAFAKLEKDGADALAGKIALGRFSDVMLVLNPRPEWNGVNAACRIRTNTAEYDISVMGGSVDDAWAAGADFAGNLLTAGVRGEGIVTWGGEEPGYARAILGADHQFSPDLYALIEYQYNGEGASDPQEYDLRALLSGRIINLGRQYLAISASYRLHDLVTGGLSVIGNLGDGSAYLGVTVDYAALGNLSLTAGGQFFAGEEGDEYWYYPAVAYLKAAFYF